MKAKELTDVLDEMGCSHWYSVHQRLFKIGWLSFYKVKGKFKFYFRKEK